MHSESESIGEATQVEEGQWKVPHLLTSVIFAETESCMGQKGSLEII